MSIQVFKPHNKKSQSNHIMLVLLMLFTTGCHVQENIIQPTPALPAMIGTAKEIPTRTASETITPTSLVEPNKNLILTSTPEPVFSFIVNGDTAFHAGPGEMDTQQYFRGMAESIAALPDVRFLVTVGDITPPQNTRWTIDQYLGKDFLWFPVVGNHDLYTPELKWLHEYNFDPNGSDEPNIVKQGPSGCEQTTYSFDYLNAHFAVLNVYCDVDNEKRTDGAIVDYLYNWLKDDLSATEKEHIFVFGHEPAFPQPDSSAGILRHSGESLDKYPVTRDRFWELLKDYRVTAYLTGHTHSYSVVDIGGVWQIDVAHSMGARTQSTRSTYIDIHVQGSKVTYDTYRVDNFTDQYQLFDCGTLVDQELSTSLQ